MSIQEHLIHKPGYRATLTTYGNISKSTALLKCTFGGFAQRIPFGKVLNSPSTVVGYDLPSTRSSLAPSFGVGKRFAKPQKYEISPDPTAYNVPSQFKRHKRMRSYCFGSGRKTLQLSRDLLPDPCSPGPHALYNPIKPIGSGGKQIEIKGKIDSTIGSDIPGPGQYNPVVGISKDGNYNFNSRWSGSKAAKWGPVHDRFRKHKSEVGITTLGPGSHEECGNIAQTLQKGGK